MVYTLKNGKQLILRQAEINDAGRLIHYVKIVADETKFLTFNGQEFNKTLAEEEQIIKGYKKSINQLFILGEIEGEIVGMLNIQANGKARTRHVGELGVSVMKFYWGEGVGSLLLQHAIEWAKKNEIIRKVNLTVTSNNEAAIYLYKKNGFEVEGLLREDICIDGTYLDSYVMGLLLDSR